MLALWEYGGWIPQSGGSVNLSFNKTGFLFCQADFGVAFITLAVRGRLEGRSDQKPSPYGELGRTYINPNTGRGMKGGG